MTLTENCVVTFLGGNALNISDGVVTHPFDLIARAAGAAREMGVALITNGRNAWEISYEILTGHVTDITDAAMPDVMPAESEVCDG